jgi:hypothetical protein
MSFDPMTMTHYAEFAGSHSLRVHADRIRGFAIRHDIGDFSGAPNMRTNNVSVVASICVCAAALLAASASASQTYNASHSNITVDNVYFRTLSVKGQEALRSLCAEHNGHVVTNDKGQLGCQVGSLNDSKNISDGAAKGQASE